MVERLIDGAYATIQNSFHAWLSCPLGCRPRGDVSADASLASAVGKAKVCFSVPQGFAPAGMTPIRLKSDHRAGAALSSTIMSSHRYSAPDGCHLHIINVEITRTPPCPAPTSSVRKAPGGSFYTGDTCSRNGLERVFLIANSEPIAERVCSERHLPLQRSQQCLQARWPFPTRTPFHPQNSFHRPMLWYA